MATLPSALNATIGATTPVEVITTFVLRDIAATSVVGGSVVDVFVVDDVDDEVVVPVAK
jgi:hypothetical protein